MAPLEPREAEPAGDRAATSASELVGCAVVNGTADGHAKPCQRRGGITPVPRSICVEALWDRLRSGGKQAVGKKSATSTQHRCKLMLDHDLPHFAESTKTNELAPLFISITAWGPPQGYGVCRPVECVPSHTDRCLHRRHSLQHQMGANGIAVRCGGSGNMKTVASICLTYTGCLWCRGRYR